MNLQISKKSIPGVFHTGDIRLAACSCELCEALEDLGHAIYSGRTSRALRSLQGELDELDDAVFLEIVPWHLETGMGCTLEIIIFFAGSSCSH
jgi:hypothetical protein